MSVSVCFYFFTCNHCIKSSEKKGLRVHLPYNLDVMHFLICRRRMIQFISSMMTMLYFFSEFYIHKKVYSCCKPK